MGAGRSPAGQTPHSQSRANQGTQGVTFRFRRRIVGTVQGIPRAIAEAVPDIARRTGDIWPDASDICKMSDAFWQMFRAFLSSARHTRPTVRTFSADVWQTEGKAGAIRRKARCFGEIVGHFGGWLAHTGGMSCASCGVLFPGWRCGGGCWERRSPNRLPAKRAAPLGLCEWGFGMALARLRKKPMEDIGAPSLGAPSLGKAGFRFPFSPSSAMETALPMPFPFTSAPVAPLFRKLRAAILGAVAGWGAAAFAAGGPEIGRASCRERVSVLV